MMGSFEAPTAGAAAGSVGALSTFRYTDIEGSTRLWEEHAAAMGPGHAQHDQLLRGGIEADGGIVIKTTGDGILAVFVDPVTAIAAAVIGASPGQARGTPWRLIPTWPTGASSPRLERWATSTMPRPSGSDPAGTTVATPGGGVAFALAAVDIGFFNRVIGIGVARPAVEADVEEASAFFDRADRHQSVAQLAGHAVPSDVVGWFEARGFARSRTWVKMWHRLDTLPVATTDLRIERIGPEWADEFARIGVIDAYGFPDVVAGVASSSVGRQGWTHYLGFDGDTPVAAAAMRIEDGVAWLGFGATRRRIEDVAANRRCSRCGCATLGTPAAGSRITETGEETPDEPNPSYRNMVRSGFELAYPRHNWVRLT